LNNYDNLVAELYNMGDLVHLLSLVASEEHAECLSPVAPEEMENALQAVSCYIKRVSLDLMEYDAEQIPVVSHPATARAVIGA